MIMEDLEVTLKNLPKLLKEREEALDQREKELEHWKATIEQDNPSAGRPGDVLRLNVGGSTRIDVLRRTLTQMEGSMLASKFSGRWDDNLEKDADGNFFIDQPPELFVPLINFLRARASETPLALKAVPPAFSSSQEYNDFYRMVEYYGMTLGVYRVGVFLATRDLKTELVTEGPEYIINSENWTTYGILPLPGNHSRKIKSFEVSFLQPHPSAQIGWLDWSERESYFETENGRGVGYVEASNIAFDCVRSGIVVNQSFSPLLATATSTVMTERIVIRSENFGREWYIDGKLVASSTIEENDVDNNVLQFRHWSPENVVPCLSVKGSCTITNIELEF